MSHIEIIFILVLFLVSMMLWKIVSIISELRTKSVNYPHLGWLIAIAFHLVLFLWLSLKNQDVDVKFYSFIALILPALLLVHSVSIITPSERPKDWTFYFEQNRKRFFISYLVFWLGLDVSQYVIYQTISPAILPWFICLIGIFSSNKIVQWILPVILGVLVILFGFLNSP